MTTLEKIAKRNVSRLLETKSTFELLIDFTKLYDMTSGNDRLLTEHMLNELGYTKASCGWILDRK